MKLTRTGYRLNKNGKANIGIEQNAMRSDVDLGKSVKENGTYFFFSRKQGDTYIYLP
jgi:hypothetical protein